MLTFIKGIFIYWRCKYYYKYKKNDNKVNVDSADMREAFDIY